jgi:hypothetical protein
MYERSKSWDMDEEKDGQAARSADAEGGTSRQRPSKWIDKNARAEFFARKPETTT